MMYRAKFINTITQESLDWMSFIVRSHIDDWLFQMENAGITNYELVAIQRWSPLAEEWEDD